jgi:hypothetical protein
MLEVVAGSRQGCLHTLRTCFRTQQWARRLGLLKVHTACDAWYAFHFPMATAGMMMQLSRRWSTLVLL